MADHLLSVVEFYTQVSRYMQRVDPVWEDDVFRAGLERERVCLPRVLGDGNGRRVLDCSCGTGVQAIPLAELGWTVTATDLTEAYLESARRRAAALDLTITWDACDMRQLGERFGAEFDRVISCMALDNLLGDGDLQRAVAALLAVLKPGGICYVRLRDFDQVITDRPRYEFREERPLPRGRMIRLEDWEFEGDTHAINVYAFLHEDRGRTGYAWETAVFAYRRRALRARDLERLFRSAGFADVGFLPQSSRWAPLELVASKG